MKTQPQPLPGLPLLGREPPGLVTDPAFRRQAIAAYRACVSFADAQVGVVLDALDRADALEGHRRRAGRRQRLPPGRARRAAAQGHALRGGAARAPDRGGAGARAPGRRGARAGRAARRLPDDRRARRPRAPAGLDGQSLVPLLRDPRARARRGRLVPPRAPAGGHGRSADRGVRYTLWPDGSEELYEGCPCPPESPNLAASAWLAAEASLRARLEELVARGTKAP